MPTAPRYFLLEEGQRTGPHSLAVLKQKAEVRVLTADSLIAHETEPDAWAPLGDFQVLCDELLPVRTRYALAPDHKVEHVNTPGETAPPTVQELLRANAVRERSAIGELLAPLPRRSNKRLRDYLILVVCGNLLALLAFLFLPMNPVSFVYLVAFVAIYNTSLPWVMFAVMDRY